MRLPSLVLTLTVGLALGIATSVAAGPQARVIGTVTTADGNPIAGAVVTITCAALPTFSKELTSGDDGGYRVLLLDSTQTYVFRVEAPGFVAHEEEVKVPVGTTDNERNFTLVTPAAAASSRQADLLEQPGYRELERGAGQLSRGDRGPP